MQNFDELAEGYLGLVEKQKASEGKAVDSFSRGDMETCFVSGAQSMEQLQEGSEGTFGQAVGSLKHGFLVRRKGWNGKGMFLFLRPWDSLNDGFIIDTVKSLPWSFKAWVKAHPNAEGERLFKQQYVRNGLVMIQPIVNKDMNDVMIADSEAGFIFNNEHNLDIALWLVRRWGFSVTKRCEHDDRREYTAYIVQLPDDYLMHHVGSDKVGIIRTGLRSISNVDRTKKQKPFDWTV